jgi:hypothetical protein
MKKMLLIIVILLLANTVSYGGDVTGYIELLKSDMRTEKVAIITEAMQLTKEEASVFWPVQREYELELSHLIDDDIGVIRDYVQHYENLTDEKAGELVDRVFVLEKKRLKLKKKYFKKFEKALSTTIAAKFMLQVEEQINLLIDLQIASELPLIK